MAPVGVAASAVGPGISWYDVLGVLPTATTGEIRRGYDAMAGLLQPGHLSGANSTVLSATRRAQEILDAAWQVLGDARGRAGYDELLGIWRTGEGLAPPPGVPSQPGWDTSGLAPIAAARGGAVFLLGGLAAIYDLLTPSPAPALPRHVTVPEVRGLFYSVCFAAVGRLGFRVSAVRLTERPMPVDGVVVGQSPAPGRKARRDSQLTVQVWHPPNTRS
jgi:DnaJ domain/PASTA domain